MRAVVVGEVGGPENLIVVERDEPSPGRDEVSIDVAFAGVGFVDTLFRSGGLPLRTPFVPGIEVTGHVRDVGDGVTDLIPGQPVAALLNDFGRTQRAGGYAQVAVAHHTMTTALSETSDLPTVTGVLINGVTAWIALHDIAAARPSDTAVVIGASGGLGSVTARLAALVPCRRVVGVVSHDSARAPEQCTDVVLTDDLDYWVAAAENAIDIVIDPVGGHTRQLLFNYLAPFGRHIILGNASGDDVAVSSDETWHGTRTLSGISLGAIAHLRPGTIRTALTSVLALLDRRLLAEPSPDIQPLSRVRDVHEALENRTAPHKTVLDVSR
ncbi:MAG: quinone oxidoreductase family protein [Terriglobales bacterium]